MPTRASKRKQGMAKEHEPEPAAAIATGIEGPRTDYKHEVHNADRGNAIKNNPPPSLYRPSTREETANAGENVGRRQRTREEQEAANTEERNMSGMSEYLTGRSDGMKGAQPRETEGQEPHATREDATATKHTNHKPDGTKRASGMPTHASRHEQGMAREREPEPAAENTTGIEGPRMDKENDVAKQRRHASAPADRETAKKPTLLPLSVGHQRGRKHHTTSRPARTSHRTATATNKHHGMNTNANTGMLCATRRRTQQ